LEKIWQEIDRERSNRENEIDRERRARENEIRLMKEQSERERKEKENALRQMREKEEQNEREIADLRNKLSRASLTPQVNQNVTSFFKAISFLSRNTIL
jgi:hypothetical protein